MMAFLLRSSVLLCTRNAGKTSEAGWRPASTGRGGGTPNQRQSSHAIRLVGLAVQKAIYAILMAFLSCETHDSYVLQTFHIGSCDKKR